MIDFHWLKGYSCATWLRSFASGSLAARQSEGVPFSALSEATNSPCPVVHQAAASCSLALPFSDTLHTVAVATDCKA